MIRVVRWPGSLACVVWMTLILTLTLFTIEMLVDIDTSLDSVLSSPQLLKQVVGGDTVSARWLPVQHESDHRAAEYQLPVYVIEEHHEGILLLACLQ